LERWLKKAGITRGYIFRGIDRNGHLKKTPINPGEVNRIVKIYAQRAGLDPAIYSAHGLRRGFMTHCARMGIPIQEAMELADHSNVQTALIYYEEGSIYHNRATMI
jgi:integrase